MASVFALALVFVTTISNIVMLIALAASSQTRSSLERFMDTPRLQVLKVATASTTSLWIRYVRHWYTFLYPKTMNLPWFIMRATPYLGPT
jgi:hypothetical protein